LAIEQYFDWSIGRVAIGKCISLTRGFEFSTD